MDLPNPSLRKVWIHDYLQEPIEHDHIDYIISQTAGYSLSDLYFLFERAQIPSNVDDLPDLGKLSLSPSLESFSHRLSVVREELDRQNKTSKRQISRDFNSIKPHVPWSSISGYQDIKQKLEKLVIWPLMKPEVYSRLGISPSSGILLYGPPGVGKTMLVHGLANKAPMNFISAKTFVLDALIAGIKSIASIWVIAKLPFESYFRLRKKHPRVFFSLIQLMLLGLEENGVRVEAVGSMNESSPPSSMKWMELRDLREF
jgi:SpoVK/Ycf46/Vps4 family AAA+-type ATPase